VALDELEDLPLAGGELRVGHQTAPLRRSNMCSEQ
jgi:hypothetical protein